MLDEGLLAGIPRIQCAVAMMFIRRLAFQASYWLKQLRADIVLRCQVI